MTHHAHIRVAKARNVDGHVCGEMHHRAKAPDWVVALARDLAEANGWGRRRVCWALRHDERVIAAGIDVRLKCVDKWLTFETRTLLKPTLPP